MNLNRPPPPHYVEAGICDPTDTQSICDDSITHPTGSPDGFRLELGDQDLPILRRDCGDDVHQAGLRRQPVFGGCPCLHPERRAPSMTEVTMFQGQATTRITYKPCHQFSWLQHPLTRDNMGSNACDCRKREKIHDFLLSGVPGRKPDDQGTGPRTVTQLRSGSWWCSSVRRDPRSASAPLTASGTRPDRSQGRLSSLHLGRGQPSRGASSAHSGRVRHARGLYGHLSLCCNSQNCLQTLQMSWGWVEVWE